MTEGQVNGMNDSMDMSLSKLWAVVKDREALYAAFPGVAKSRTRLSDFTSLQPLDTVSEEGSSAFSDPGSLNNDDASVCVVRAFKIILVVFKYTSQYC